MIKGKDEKEKKRMLEGKESIEREVEGRGGEEGR